jgi:hypothetical protein
MYNINRFIVVVPNFHLFKTHLCRERESFERKNFRGVFPGKFEQQDRTSV